MKLLNRITNYPEQLQRLKQHSKCRECSGFADLCWDRLDINDIMALEENPGIMFETNGRVVVFQEIHGEIRYYAGGWGAQENIAAEPYEMGVFNDLDNALSFSEQFLIGKLALNAIEAQRRIRGGSSQA